MRNNGTAPESITLDALADALAERLRLSDGSPWMNTCEAADYLRVSERWLRQNLHQMPHSKVEGRLFFSRPDLDRWLRGRRRVDPPAAVSRPSSSRA